MTERNLRRILFPALALAIAAVMWWFEGRGGEPRPVPRAAPAPETPIRPRSADDPMQMSPIPPKPPPAMAPDTPAPR